MVENFVTFECPWCGEQQTKSVPKGADWSVLCKSCKKSIGIITDETGKPIRIGQLTSISELLKSSNQDISKNMPPVNIGSIYGSVSFGGDAITNTYNEIIQLIDKTNNMKPEQKFQAKNVLEYVKNNAPSFLPIIVEAIRKTFGL